MTGIYFFSFLQCKLTKRLELLIPTGAVPLNRLTDDCEGGFYFTDKAEAINSYKIITGHSIDIPDLFKADLVINNCPVYFSLHTGNRTLILESCFPGFNNLSHIFLPFPSIEKFELLGELKTKLPQLKGKVLPQEKIRHASTEQLGSVNFNTTPKKKEYGISGSTFILNNACLSAEELAEQRRFNALLREADPAAPEFITLPEGGIALKKGDKIAQGAQIKTRVNYGIFKLVFYTLDEPSLSYESPERPDSAFARKIKGSFFKDPSHSNAPPQRTARRALFTSSSSPSKKRKLEVDEALVPEDSPKKKHASGKENNLTYGTQVERIVKAQLTKKQIANVRKTNRKVKETTSNVRGISQNQLCGGSAKQAAELLGFDGPHHWGHCVSYGSVGGEAQILENLVLMSAASNKSYEHLENLLAKLLFQHQEQYHTIKISVGSTMQEIYGPGTLHFYTTTDPYTYYGIKIDNLPPLVICYNNETTLPPSNKLGSAFFAYIKLHVEKYQHLMEHDPEAAMLASTEAVVFDMFSAELPQAVTSAADEMLVLSDVENAAETSGPSRLISGKA